MFKKFLIAIFFYVTCVTYVTSQPNINFQVLDAAGNGRPDVASVCHFKASPYTGSYISGITVTYQGPPGVYLASGFTTYQFIKLYINDSVNASFSEQLAGDPFSRFASVNASNIFTALNYFNNNVWFYYPMINPSSTWTTSPPYDNSIVCKGWVTSQGYIGTSTGDSRYIMKTTDQNLTYALNWDYAATHYPLIKDVATGTDAYVFPPLDYSVATKKYAKDYTDSVNIKGKYSNLAYMNYANVGDMKITGAYYLDTAQTQSIFTNGYDMTIQNNKSAGSIQNWVTKNTSIRSGNPYFGWYINKNLTGYPVAILDSTGYNLLTGQYMLNGTPITAGATNLFGYTYKDTVPLFNKSVQMKSNLDFISTGGTDSSYFQNNSGYLKYISTLKHFDIQDTLRVKYISNPSDTIVIKNKVKLNDTRFTTNCMNLPSTGTNAFYMGGVLMMYNNGGDLWLGGLHARINSTGLLVGGGSTGNTYIGAGTTGDLYTFFNLTGEGMGILGTDSLALYSSSNPNLIVGKYVIKNSLRTILPQLSFANQTGAMPVTGTAVFNIYPKGDKLVIYYNKDGSTPVYYSLDMSNFSNNWTGGATEP